METRNKIILLALHFGLASLLLLLKLGIIYYAATHVVIPVLSNYVCFGLLETVCVFVLMEILCFVSPFMDSMLYEQVKNTLRELSELGKIGENLDALIYTEYEKYLYDYVSSVISLVLGMFIFLKLYIITIFLS